MDGLDERVAPGWPDVGGAAGAVAVRLFGERLPAGAEVTEGGDLLVGVVGLLNHRDARFGQDFGEPGGRALAVPLVAKLLRDVVELPALGGGDQRLDGVAVVVEVRDGGGLVKGEELV